jgi:hypothetical protein
MGKKRVSSFLVVTNAIRLQKVFALRSIRAEESMIAFLIYFLPNVIINSLCCECVRIAFVT